MQPIGVVWNKLPRLVRDVAVGCGKQIALEMEGAGTEMDKTIIETIEDPPTHIVRNCGDRGIERWAWRGPGEERCCSSAIAARPAISPTASWRFPCRRKSTTTCGTAWANWRTCREAT
jgi:hypothetical protein